MAVNSENMTVQYFAQVEGSFFASDRLAFDYTQVNIAALGMDETQIRDHFNGEMFAIDNQYFASVRRNENAFLMVLRPLVFIDGGIFLSVIFVSADIAFLYPADLLGRQSEKGFLKKTPGKRMIRRRENRT